MGKEIYAKNYLDEYYARGENSDQYYAKNEDGTYYFAKNEFGEDIYARNSDGSLSDQLPITRQERNFYIKDKEGNEIYNKMNGKEMVVLIKIIFRIMQETKIDPKDIPWILKSGNASVEGPGLGESCVETFELLGGTMQTDFLRSSSSEETSVSVRWRFLSACEDKISE
ncbi:hypothetical protein TNCT_448031 [Trichonephila clavata]|uniref:Uncharacterized protein n=1 Tax=Trichonephila clavata TaxID=2740835 RepID=A0A8X6KJM8_TRICU|nr:hypothetical protein TNCT_448031 [Trichonephila clavata]